jgi:hypothetical protein
MGMCTGEVGKKTRNKGRGNTALRWPMRVMKETGNTMIKMVKVSTVMPLERSTEEDSKITRRQVEGLWPILQGHRSLANGRKTLSKDRLSSIMPMGMSMKATSKRGSSMAMASTPTKQEMSMRGAIQRISRKEKESTLSPRGASTKA